jgi:hypothetical protein
MKRPAKPSTEPPEIVDEPGMEERFQRALRKALNTPPKHRTAPTPKTKERPASKGAFTRGRLAVRAFANSGNRPPTPSDIFASLAAFPHLSPERSIHKSRHQGTRCRLKVAL